VDPQGLALDRTGDLFVVNEAQVSDAAGEVLELVRSQPPTLTFAPTGVGSASSSPRHPHSDSKRRRGNFNR
jgi:hypothetical protein